MGAKEYLAAHKLQSATNATIEHDLEKAFLLAKDEIRVDADNPNSNLDLDKFTDSTYNSGFAQKLVDGLAALSHKRYKSGLDPNNPEEALLLDRQAYGDWGFKESSVLDYLNSAGRDLSVSTFMGHVNQNTAYGHMQSQNLGSAKKYLDPKDTKDVLNMTGILNKVSASELSKDELAAILDEWHKNKRIGWKFLRGKRYLKDGVVEEDESTAIPGLVNLLGEPLASGSN